MSCQELTWIMSNYKYLSLFYEEHVMKGAPNGSLPSSQHSKSHDVRDGHRQAGSSLIISQVITWLMKV